MENAIAELENESHELIDAAWRSIDADSSGPQFRPKTLDHLEWHEVREQIGAFVLSPEGGLMADALGPLKSRSLARLRMAQVSEYMEVLESEGEAPLRGLRDVRDALAYAQREGMLAAEDLEAISRNCDVASRVGRFFKHRSDVAPHLAKVAVQLDPCLDLREALNHAIEPGGRLKDHASPDLKKLRRAVHHQADRIKARVERMLRSDDLEQKLQDDYYTVREDRFVLPVRSGARSSVDGIVHGYSSSGQTAFVEPQELIELNNQLRWAQIDVEEEERRILTRLSRLVANHVDVLRANGRILAYLDLIHACGRWAEAVEASPCRIEQGELTLKRLRHPLLDLKLRREAIGEKTVANDVSMVNGNVLIVSGPNTGGKTVLLKAVGLAALMARSGLPLACDEESVIPFFDAVYTDIGDEQSIEHDLSTFSSHLVNIISFLPDSNSESLVLLDELFAGTDPHQGSALAVSLLEDLARRRATTLATTHLEGLKTLALEDETFVNASMGFDIETLEPTYELTQGIPGSSFALRIADRLGFPGPLVERAREVLDGEGKLSVDEILNRLEDQAAELSTERKRFERMRHEAEASKRKFKDKHQKLVERERGMISDEARDLKKKLSEARRVLKERLKEVSDDGTVTRKDVEDVRDELRTVESAVDDVRERTEVVETTNVGLVPVKEQDIEVGMDVFVGSFKRSATVIEYDGGNQAQVQVGVMKTHVDIGELYYPSESDRQTHRSSGPSVAPEPAKPSETAPVQTSENTVDLRGLRVDEATEKVDLFLDAATLSNQRAVYIIHGHGTGALKRAMRDYLPDSRYVASWRRGERGEGGDGVTVAFLKRGA